MKSEAKGLAESLAFTGLCVCCTCMEVSGVEGGAGGLWIIVVIWAFFGG